MENSGEFAHQNFLTLVAEEAWLGAPGAQRPGRGCVRGCVTWLPRYIVVFHPRLEHEAAAPTQHAWWW